MHMNELTKNPVLWNLDPSRKFVLQMDTSDLAIGAVLSHEDENENGAVHLWCITEERYYPHATHYGYAVVEN